MYRLGQSSKDPNDRLAIINQITRWSHLEDLHVQVLATSDSTCQVIGLSRLAVGHLNRITCNKAANAIASQFPLL